MPKGASDIQLTVGLNKTLSYTQLKTDISSVISRINKNPPKIKVSLVTNNAAVNDLRRQISEKINKNPPKINIKLNTRGSVVAGGKTGASATSQAAFNTEAAIKRVINAQNSVNGNLSKWTAASSMPEYADLKNYATQLNSLYDRLNNGTIKPKEFAKEFGTITNGIAKANQQIIFAGKNTKSWSDRMGGLAEKFNTWLTISKLIMAAYRAIGKMVRNVIALDTAMTELKKVTNETDAAYAAFLDRAEKRAKSLGATLTDTVNATADFARLGYGIHDAEKLADVAVVYKNVGDGIDSIDTASESIIATMQAFGIAADDAMSIVDKFNEVGNNYAISSKGVGDALLRSAAAMHSANNSLDETIALATAANTVVKFVPRCYGNIAA